MTAKADFTEQEWDQIRSAPTTAGLMVMTAQKGGLWKETVAMAKAYAEARQAHGESRLLDDLTAAKPKMDHGHYHSFEELKEHGLKELRDAVQLLESKGATPEEIDDYRRFVLAVSEKVAASHREDGVDVTDAERAAIDEITAALAGAPA